MKAILADLFLSSLFYCCSSNIPVFSEPSLNWRAELFLPAIESDTSTLYPTIGESYKYQSYSFVPTADLTKFARSAQELIASPNIDEKLTQSNDRASLWHTIEETDYTLSAQPLFWSNPRSFKYWGLSQFTRIELPKTKTVTPSRVKFNLVEKADSLSESSFMSDRSDGLIVSGSDKQKLLYRGEQEHKLPDFRGGIAYNQGLSQDVTLGVGFFYNELFKGFGRLSFKPTDLPLEATFSLLNGSEEGVDVHSDISFKPSRRLALNYHSNSVFQKFDLKWQPFSSINLAVEGDSKDHSLNAKLDLTLKKDDLSVFARVDRDINDRWKWEFKSSLDYLQITHHGGSDKTTSELAYNFGSDRPANSQYALFANYQTSNVDRDWEDLVTFGWRYHSSEKLGNNYFWQLDLGYGTGSQESGLIVSASKAFLPELVLKVSYQQVSVFSEEGNFKIEFSSK
jgi:hypothetical protein